ncbi:ester hydrolase C11orf54 homolog [Argonauta hians]
MSGGTPQLPSTTFKLKTPDKTEIVTVLGEGLKKYFQDVSVNIVDCPNLTQEPFHLAAEGICGNPCLADVGGPPYLLPTVCRDKVYNFESLADIYGKKGFFIGAGAGPAHKIGVNSEMMCNVNLSKPDGYKTYIAKLNKENDSHILENIDHTSFMLMANLLCCEGKPGKVLEIKAGQRIGDDNFPTAIRKCLKSKYGEEPVALGGLFIMEQGKAKFHIMRDFSCEPIKSTSQLDNWLYFYEAEAPLVCLGELVSHDPDLDLRVEHFHGFSQHGHGGHYHYDITPKEVRYRAYFSVAEILYRIDKPEHPLILE